VLTVGNSWQQLANEGRALDNSETAMRFFLLLLTAYSAQAASVAIVLAGLWRGSTETASEFQRALVQPFMHSNIDVGVFAAIHRHDLQHWKNWFLGANVTSPNIVFLEDQVIGNVSLSHFATCSLDPVGYHNQFSKLEIAWRAVERSGIAYDWVIKTRNDYVFNPKQKFKPCWLTELPPKVMLTTDKEPHQEDRWNERGTRIWADFIPHVFFPIMTSDSMYYGHYEDMKRQLTIDSVPPYPEGKCLDERFNTRTDDHSHIEAIMADNAFRANVLIATTTFQANKPGGEFNDAPCLLCYDCSAHF
jgi:hypothetical protein